MSQITTITFFKYDTFLNKLWAFSMMQFAHAPLSKVAGLQQYKLMGSGKHGFKPFPDWSVYALLQIWDNEAAANTFFETSGLLKRYLQRSEERCTLFLKSTTSKGKWSGANPFQKSGTIDPDNHYIAVITRATIKISKLYTFWKYVPTSQRALPYNRGLIYSKGIGEVPFLQMATFSIWKNKEALGQFAYGSREHADAISKTKRLNWYSEELFSRFQPYKSIGAWKSMGPIPF